MDEQKQSLYRAMDRQYVPQIIREYELWTLAINDNQNYLGRMYIWLVREGGMQRFSGLTKAELFELQTVCRDAEFALDALWQPDHMNYAMLGNLFGQHGGHAHMHLIPRYARSRWYRNRSYEDTRWGSDYKPAHDFKPDQVTLFAIRDDLKRAIAV